MQHMPISATIKKSDRIINNGAMRTRGRSKLTWMVAIKKDMMMLNVTDKMTLMNLNGIKGFL